MNDIVKLDFEDGSFILLESKNEDEINVIMCGRKNANEVTMSSSSLNKDQAEKIYNFLEKWISFARNNHY